MGRFVAAIDQGTTSTRCIVFDRAGIVGSAQKEHRQIYPEPGWVEHDPDEIWKRTCQVVTEALAAANTSPRDIHSIGITNQRETTLVWNRKTGRPYGNAIVWQDTRTKDICDALTAQASEIRARSGLPVATYFSAPKLRWMLDNDPQLKRDAQNGDALFGTIDTWLIWNLTGQHLTDVTNASRTMLMNLQSLQWDDELLRIFDIPRGMLPRIVPSVLGDDAPRTSRNSPVGSDVPIHGILGDQQAALFGQCCFSPGQAKNTYGTGCFLLMNVGEKPVISNSGLLTTVGYQLADGRIAYALEGSIAIAGALVQWLRDNLGIIQSSDEIEALARSVPDNGGVYFVPAFSGLFAPHWRSDARGTIVGLSAHSNRAHLARAVLEAAAYQTADVVDAIAKDSGTALKELKVDGGMTRNELLMQFQADILNVPVSLPTISETTALGAAYAAGLGSGYFASLDELRLAWKQSRRWTPAVDEQIRANLLRHWRKAIERSLEWFD